jgi:Flp pilus assembly pilin Flp
MKQLLAVLCDDSGAAMVEFAIIMALLTAASLTILSVTATGASNQLLNDQDNLVTVQTSP